MKHYIFLFLLLLITAFQTFAGNLGKRLIQGVVIDEHGQPISGATITTSYSKERGATGSDGKFTINVADKGTLYISCVGYEKQAVRISNQKSLTIKMTSSNILLPEVTVTSVLKKNMKFVFEPSELEVIKEQLLLKTRYRVPEQRFHKDSRMIIQPFLVNFSRNKRTSFTPMVYDGVNYDILVRRGHSCGDPEEQKYFSKFAQVVDGFDSSQLITYTDTCQMDDVNDRYATEVYIKIKTFCEDEYQDTLTIARGIIYPMRFFDFNAASFDLDDSYAPRQQALNFNEKGEMHLRFRPSEYKIFETDGRNGFELNKFRKLLNDIHRDSTKKLTYFSITGYASPEGSYKMNEKLSSKRVKSALEAILKKIPDSSKSASQARFESEGIVVPWDTIYAAMLRDSLIKESAELKMLLRRARGNHDEVSWASRRLKCYPLIRDKYLPRFRRVEYNYEYTEYRTLNFNEIDEIYCHNPSNLTASEFWRYIRGHADSSTEEVERLMREALKYHPDLMIAANNLSALLNREHRADTTLLLPFLRDDAPIEIKVNHIVALLQKRNFEEANRLSQTLPRIEKTRAVLAIADAMNGRYAEAYEYFADTNSINKAILLLSLRRNQEAWDFLKELPDSSAEVDYVRAITANRLNDINTAILYLHKALAQKPELRKIMEIDGDILDLKDFIE